MKEIRRVCFYGGPGSGKTTSAMLISSQLKIAGVNVEHVQEEAKRWVYEGRTIQGFDQVVLLATQLSWEELYLRKDPETVIVTESPLFLGLVYSKLASAPCWRNLIPIAEEFESVYPGIHIFVERGTSPYQPKGRYEDEEAARRIDTFTKLFLDEIGIKYHVIPQAQLGLMTQCVFNALGVGAIL